MIGLNFWKSGGAIVEQEAFLAKNNISQEDFLKASIDWNDLLAIYKDFEQKRPQLESVAEFVVKGIQAFDEVHSVRWRVKDPEHLIEKIIRKRCDPNPSKKYLEITVDNYTKVVTDLVGVRALHLFKDQVFDIHARIKDFWGFAEKPISYIRAGDHSDLLEKFRCNGITPKTHGAGYRSVHYILKVKPNLLEFRIELQVRTIFEEGWSEIDHKVRYPNFSNNKQVETILKIFNRLAGSADELGAFIRGLSLEIDRYQEQLVQTVTERDEALQKMQQTLDDLEAFQQQNGEASGKVKELQLELSRLKKSMGARYQVGLNEMQRAALVSSPGLASIMNSATSSILSSSLISNWLEQTKENND